MARHTMRLWQYEDTPLFSGTAQRTSASKPNPTRPAPPPLPSVKCRACMDTGEIKIGTARHYCWCEAGVYARARG